MVIYFLECTRNRFDAKFGLTAFLLSHQRNVVYQVLHPYPCRCRLIKGWYTFAKLTGRTITELVESVLQYSWINC